MLMKSFGPPASLVNRVLAGTILAIAYSLVSLKSASAQSVTLDFRFDPTDTGFNAATPNAINPIANHDYTVDVFVTVFGDSSHTNVNNYGLNAVLIRGYSQAIASGAPGAALTGGSGIGVTTSAPFFAATSPFTSGQVTAPTVGDSGSTTNGTSAVATLDAIADFGSRANNAADLNMNNGNSSVMASAGGTAGTGANAGGWTFELCQFVFHTGATLGPTGSETDFWPTRVAGTTTAASITQDGVATDTVNIASTSENIGTPLGFVVAPAGTTVSVTPAAATASVLKGGSISLGATLNNTGSVGMNGGDYTFTTSGGINITYGTAAPPTATTAIASGGSQGFTFATVTNPGPVGLGGTPIGIATVTFTANNNGGSKIANAPQTGTTQLNVGGAIADNTNHPGVYGPALTAPVAGGRSYGGLESAVVGLQATGGSNAAVSPFAPPWLGGDAKIMAGTNNSATQRTISMAWRTRLVGSPTNGLLDETHGGPGSALQVTTSTTGLVSDVVNLTGLETGSPNPTSTDPFVLDMTYNPALLPKGGPLSTEQSLANNKLIYMVSPLPGPDDGHSQYFNTVLLNTGNTVSQLSPDYGVVQGWNAYATAKFGTTNPTGAQLASDMGAWGVDTGAHEVWAVVDHNSTFAVVPEPSTVLLAFLGLLGLVYLRRRARVSLQRRWRRKCV
jgi:hypothetical protein